MSVSTYSFRCFIVDVVGGLASVRGGRRRIVASVMMVVRRDSFLWVTRSSLFDIF